MGALRHERRGPPRPHAPSRSRGADVDRHAFRSAALRRRALHPVRAGRGHPHRSAVPDGSRWSLGALGLPDHPLRRACEPEVRHSEHPGQLRPRLLRTRRRPRAHRHAWRSAGAGWANAAPGGLGEHPGQRDGDRLRGIVAPRPAARTPLALLLPGSPRRKLACRTHGVVGGGRRRRSLAHRGPAPHARGRGGVRSEVGSRARPRGS
jgi:hypothetical protein